MPCASRLQASRSTHRRRILYSLPDGAQSSTLLRTELFEGLLAADDLEWTFVSPIAADPHFAEEFARRGCTLHHWPSVRPSLLDRQLFWLRQELWRARVDNESTSVYARRMRFTEPKRYHVHRRIARLTHHGQWIDRILNGLEAAFVSDGELGTLLDEAAPEVVVLGSAGIKPQDVPLGRAARRRRLPLLGVVPSWDNLTSKGPLQAKCDRLAVWCDQMSQEAVDLCGYRPDELVVTGPPQFDPHFEPAARDERARFFARIGLDPNLKLITYTSVPAGNCPFGTGFVELLAGLLSREMLGWECQLLVRLHPQDDFEAFEKLPQRANVRIERPGRYHGSASGQTSILKYNPTSDDTRHLTQTLRYSDVVVNIASTIALEACLLDRPVVNIAFNLDGSDGFIDLSEYYRTTHFRTITQSGATRIVRSAGELREALRDSLAHPGRLSTQRRRLYRHYDSFCDGKSARRLAQAIATFARGDSHPQTAWERTGRAA
jgi:hypothetical protein